jgi:hypothetical protein
MHGPTVAIVDPSDWNRWRRCPARAECRHHQPDEGWQRLFPVAK